MPGVIATIPRFQFSDALGAPLVNGTLTVYLAGTTTPTPTWQDSAQSILNTNPITLDSRGECVIWLDSAVIYKFLLKNSAGTTQWTVDNISGAEAAGSNLAALLAASSGSSLVGFLQAGTGATARTVQSKLRDSVSVKDFGAVGDGVANDRAACQAAIDYLVGSTGGGSIYFPKGTYLINSVASADSTPNGLLLPDTNGGFGTANGITLYGDGNESIIKAGNTAMCVIRNSRLYTTIKDLMIDGGPKTQVIGLGVIPENVAQTTELVSNSFMTLFNVHIENCRRGMMFQPGPTVLGADSGCFYHSIYNLVSNLNDEHVYMITDVTGAGNRVTRTTFHHCVFLRGNTGCNIYAGTELDFVSCWFEMINSGTVPNAVPVAFNYADSNPANIRLIGGYAEACTLSVIATNPEQVSLINFRYSGAGDPSEAGMLAIRGGALNIARSVAGGNPPVYISGVNSGFCALVIDPLATNSKRMDVVTNSITNFGWFNRATTHYGTLGDVVWGSTGASMEFSSTGTCSITTGAGSSFVQTSDQFYWRGSTSGTDIVRCAAAGTLSLFPASDNAIVLGQNGFRWSAVWAANGTIQTSDPRTKKDISDSVLGLDFINELRPVQYKFKVGGNIITGTREIKPAVMRWDEQTAQEVVEIAAETENVVEAIPGKRQHFGFLTTEVKVALEKCGNPDFGGYVKIDPADPASEEALRYDEFIAPLVKAVQELTARIIQLENK